MSVCYTTSMAERLGHTPADAEYQGDRLAERKPAFDGGAFTISAFSPSTEGFQIRTRNVIGRTEGLADNRALDNDARARLKAAMKGEMAFNGAKKIVEAEKPLRDAQAQLKALQGSGADQEEIQALEDRIKELREAHRGEIRNFRESPAFESYKKKMPGKYGIRNVVIDGNTVTVDAKVVSFPVYNQFARPEDSPELIDLSANAAGAMIVRSKDGRLVIQHRAVAKQRLTEEKLSRGNAVFVDQPGASAAGMLDASTQGENRQAGRPDPIDTGSVKGAILKEAGEELGLHDDDLRRVRIVGLAHDKIKIHDEFLLLADANLTAEQIRERSRTSNRNKNLGDADFEEKFIDIDGSADSISTLLTKVKCPLPPTHAAALVASGYSLVLQEQGKDAADAWKAQVEQGVKENYADIDRRVKAFYDQHPEALMQVPERFWGKEPPARKLHGYDPVYAPDEQGLPSFEEAMVEAGLMPETRKHVPEVLMFDVDGPLSDPQEKQIKYDELITILTDRLAAWEPVFLNTGRSTEWIMDRVTPRLRNHAKDPSVLKNLVIIGEKGGTWVTFNEQGEEQHGKSAAISVPDEVNQATKRLVQEKYGDCMFFDATKQTMMSIEMQDGYDKNDFAERQKDLVNDLNVLLTEKGLGGLYKVDPTTIATDVESPYVGKALGADRALQWLRDNNIRAGRFVTFGDSTSDLEMADELQRKGIPVEFVYVGEAQKLADHQAAGKVKDPSIIRNIGDYSKGTLRYFADR